MLPIATSRLLLPRGSAFNCCIAGLVAIICGYALPVWSDDSVGRTPGSDWSFNLAPYVWAAGLKGTVAAVPGLPSIKVDAGFRDILENLDIAAMVFGELRYQRFSAYADIVYTKITVDAETPAQILFDNIETESSIFIGTFGGAYRLFDEQNGFFDLLAGARLWSVKTQLDFDGGVLNSQDFDDDQTWVDPVIGVKARFDIGAGFFLNALCHVGGFGVASDLTWDAFGGFGYQFNETISAIAGYRHLEVDYHHDGFVFDVELSGPVIGATFRF